MDEQEVDKLNEELGIPSTRFRSIELGSIYRDLAAYCDSLSDRGFVDYYEVMNALHRLATKMLKELKP